MKLCVVMACYNHGHYLAGWFESVLSQSRPADEIVIVDDASTDGSDRLLEKYQHQIPYLKVLRNEKNLGVHDSWNRGVLAAKSDIIVGSGTDDIFSPGFFEEGMKVFERYPNIGLCCGDFGMFRDQLPRKIESVRILDTDQTLYIDPDQLIKLSKKHDFLVPSNSAMYKRELLVKYGPYDSSLKSLADYYLCHQIALRYPIVYVPKAFSAFRVVSNSYGDKIRRNFRSRYKLFDLLTKRIWQEEDPSFRVAFNRSGILSFNGYFLILFLVSRPRYWHHLVCLFPQILRKKFKYWLMYREGNFGPLYKRIFRAKVEI